MTKEEKRWQKEKKKEREDWAWKREEKNKMKSRKCFKSLFYALKDIKLHFVIFIIICKYNK